MNAPPSATQAHASASVPLIRAQQAVRHVLDPLASEAGPTEACPAVAGASTRRGTH